MGQPLLPRGIDSIHPEWLPRLILSLPEALRDKNATLPREESATMHGKSLAPDRRPFGAQLEARAAIAREALTLPSERLNGQSLLHRLALLRGILAGPCIDR